MSLMPSKIGAEPKKLIYLGILVLIAIVAYFLNRTPGDSGPSSTVRTATVGTRPNAAARPAATRSAVRVTQAGVGRTAREYRPSLKPPKDVEPASIDPRLHLAALARLQDVTMAGTSRSLFEISAAPPAQQLAVAEPKPIRPSFIPMGPPAPPPPAPPPPTPRAPPIPLKFYGFVNPARPDVKQAFFIETPDILIAGKSNVIKKRYKVIRIGVNSAEVEDTQFKGDNTKQTLPLEVELQG